jgi:hypothetical protein
MQVKYVSVPNLFIWFHLTIVTLRGLSSGSNVSLLHLYGFETYHWDVRGIMPTSCLIQIPEAAPVDTYIKFHPCQWWCLSSYLQHTLEFYLIGARVCVGRNEQLFDL